MASDRQHHDADLWWALSGDDGDLTNKTQFAHHYLTATLLLLDGLATPQGEIFAYANSEADAALDFAGTKIETGMAHALVAQIYLAAVSFGIHVEHISTEPPVVVSGVVETMIEQQRHWKETKDDDPS